MIVARPLRHERLPATRVLHFYDPEHEADTTMEFRLTYRGSLPAQGASSNRAREKHIIRKQFHLQLRELWRQDPQLRQQWESMYCADPAPDGMVAYRHTSNDPAEKPWPEHIANEYQRCGGRFLPLIRKSNGFTCSLEIFFFCVVMPLAD